MKKSLITGGLIAGAVLGALIAGNAMAADMPAKAPMLMKAPPPSFSWTGCYIGVGGGYGMWNQETFHETDPGLIADEGTTTTGGGRGWFGTGQVGCDYQIASSWVIGAFGDWDWGSLRGTPHFNDGFVGDEKNSWTWGAGGRIGYVMAPQFLTYVAGGYTQAHFDQVNLGRTRLPGSTLSPSSPENTYHGWFLATGYEYGLSFLPGLFWKTEYRYSTYQAADLSQISAVTGISTGDASNSKKWIQTIRSELVFRFNMFH